MIILTDISLLIIVPSDIIISIFPYLVLTYLIECDIKVLKYLPLDTNWPDSMTCPSIVLFSWRVYGEDENSTMEYPWYFLLSESMVPIESIWIVWDVLFIEPHNTLFELIYIPSNLYLYQWNPLLPYHYVSPILDNIFVLLLNNISADTLLQVFNLMLNPCHLWNQYKHRVFFLWNIYKDQDKG